MDIQSLYINGEKRGRIAVANNFFLRLRGMLGRRFTDFEALMISPCSEIHTMFMAYPIDVLFVSRTGVVVKAVESVKPWIPFVGAPEALFVIEMPSGMIKEQAIVPGMKVLIR